MLPPDVITCHPIITTLAATSEFRMTTPAADQSVAHLPQVFGGRIRARQRLVFTRLGAVDGTRTRNSQVNNLVPYQLGDHIDAVMFRTRTRNTSR